MRRGLKSSTMWTFIGAVCTAAATAVAGPCGPGNGPCDQPNGTPGCDDVACCKLICSQDSFCCDTEWDQICANAAIEQCGAQPCDGPACGKANVECLTGVPYANSRHVGQLRSSPNGAGFCTAWIVAAPNCLITNDHCTPSPGDWVAFDYECTTCAGGECKDVVLFQVTNVVTCNADQDWCLFQVDGNPAAQFGQASIDPSVATVGMPIYEIHHAEGGKKGTDDGVVTQLFVNVGCPGNIPEHAVSVIASQGASGSPVYRADNDCVTAICNCGPACSEGFVLPMSTVWPNIQAALDTTGCVYQLCGQQGPCGPGAGPCGQPNGTPGCDDVKCCETVCAVDPFCCDNQWDQICADEAVQLCTPPAIGACCVNGECVETTEANCASGGGKYFGDGSVCTPNLCEPPSVCGPGAGPCDQPNGTPGCDDVACCELICGQDPFCCDTEWDQICANAAIEQCTPDPIGACCVGGQCQEVTAEQCADAGGDYFGDGSACSPNLCTPPTPCGPGAGPCDQPNGTPGCEDVKCCETVCAIDPFCCDNTWDQLCANQAIEQCTPDPTGACCVPTPNGGGGFACMELTEIECANFGGKYFGDGSVCSPDLCAPPSPCGPGAGPCGQPNGTPGCEDVKCCETVCAVDPFCCDNQWDQICANEAIELCTPPATGACCVATPAAAGGPGGFVCMELSEAECATFGGKYFGDGSVCTPDLCEGPSPCGPGAGPCDQPNGTPGCEDVECCETVCAADPFCCDTEWDQICADEAATLCVPPCPCQWDLDGNCNVGPSDLAILLANWNQPYGPADLAALLAEWNCSGW